MTGQVYFIECAGRIKVGYTADIIARVQTLSTAAPAPLKVLGSVDGTRSLEKAIHAKLKPFNNHREWFNDCPEVRELVASVLERGASAISFKEKAPRKIFIPMPQVPASPEWWQVAVKGYGAIFNRYEYTILNHPSAPIRKAAFLALKSAQDEVEKMLDRSDVRPATPDAHQKIQTWLDALERKISEIISTKAA